MQTSYEHRPIGRFQRGDQIAMEMLVDHDIDGKLRSLLRMAKHRKHDPLICVLFTRLGDDFVLIQAC
jgi:hypothetical protein